MAAKNSSKIESWKRRRAILEAQLQGVDLSNVGSMEDAEIRIRVELLDKMLDNFEAIQSNIEEVDPDEINGNARNTFMPAFITCKTAFLKEQATRRSASTPHHSSTIRDAVCNNSFLSKSRLPALKLPTFNGDITQWADFISMFNTMIGDDSELSKIEKLQHLRSCTTGPALDVISSFEISASNYDKAIQLLKNRFENKRLNFQGHIRHISNLAKVEDGSASRLRTLSDKMNSHVRAMLSIGSKEQLADCFLIHMVAERLDLESRTKWEEAATLDAIPTWESMARFLEKRCNLLESMQASIVKVSKGHVNNKYQSKRALVASTKVSSCILCNSDEHYIQDCSEFNKMEPYDRYKIAKSNNLCLNCLRKGHVIKTCRASKCKTCSGKHNTLLHINQQASSSYVTNASSTSVPPVVPASDHVESSQIASSLVAPQVNISSITQDLVFIATAIIFVKNRAGSSIPCRAILDSASQVNFVTNRLADQLQLAVSNVRTTVSGIGSSDLISNKEISICIQSRIGSFEATVPSVVVHTIVDNQPNFNVDCSKWKIPANIRLADPLFEKSQRVDLLIGAGLFYELLCVGQIQLGPQMPILQKTKLGWIVAGAVQSSGGNRCCAVAVAGSELPCQTDCSLEDIVKNFWQAESYGGSRCLKGKEEVECERHFVETFSRLKTGEYEVHLPSKGDLTQLKGSYNIALTRFKKLERKLEQNPELKSQYVAFLQEYLQLKHMSLVSKLPTNLPFNFLPHHCVLKSESTTTKLRVVFDGSARNPQGCSLNDLLLSGPTIQASLFAILIRFRTFKVALTGDVCKMYRCVKVAEPDSFLQCIFWRDNPSLPIQIFKLDTVTYGTKPAAFLAIRAMQQLAADESHIFPIGSKIVGRDFYVDDLITGGSSNEEVLQIYKEVSKLLSKGGFQLRKLSSSNERILEAVPESIREPLMEFHEGVYFTKTLGLIWEPKQDNFIFSFSPFRAKQITKRSILSYIARFYDPLGLIGPVITKAKIFLQHLWREQLDWDESLSQALSTSWINLSSSFEYVNICKFPRNILQPNSAVQLHAFCDASIFAYGVSVYVRYTVDKVTQCNLLCSKSRVAPLKSLTIPKLELSAAALLSDVVKSIIEMNIFNATVHCWSDSSVVLSWLKEEPSNFNIFVANRISHIQQATSGMQWHYVPSKKNPADVLSRGATPRDIMSSSLWKHGPDFLQLNTLEWPSLKPTCIELPERRRVAFAVCRYEDYTVKSPLSNSFDKLKIAYGYIFRFLSKPKERQVRCPLTTREVQRGTYLLIRLIQKIYFNADYAALERNKQIDSRSSLSSLNPFMDQYGLIRVGGRLNNSSLSFDAKHPIIIPKGHPISTAIINSFHKKLLHAGPQSLTASIRLEYWPLGGKKEVARVISKCIRCYRMRPKMMEHIMGYLPKDRVVPSRAFLVVGVDYCGPFFYRSPVRNRPAVKCYICLFICFSTKAVHMEVVCDLTTSSFLAALKRFISTRGKPSVIWSDNATNFVGARKELAELKELFLKEEHCRAIYYECLQDGIDWRFIPPRSPHFGGLWEASIKLAKYHLRRVIGLHVLDFEEFRTLSCQVSAIINSRPLCPISESTDDLDVLTPAHFLIGEPFTSVVEPDISALNIGRLSRWQRVCYMQQHFWKRWSTEYLTLLQERGKWRSSHPNIDIGAIVLIKDENSPPLKWPLGRVVEVVRGKDNIVRVVVLQTKNGLIKRAVAKISILPIDEAVGSVPVPTGGACSEKQ